MASSLDVVSDGDEGVVGAKEIVEGVKGVVDKTSDCEEITMGATSGCEESVIGATSSDVESVAGATSADWDSASSDSKIV